MNRRAFSFAVLTLALVACQRDAAGPGGSAGAGDTAAQEKELFKLLPSGATVIFGGNFMKVQDLMTSSLTKAVTPMMEKMSPGFGEWMQCYTERAKQLVVAVRRPRRTARSSCASCREASHSMTSRRVPSGRSSRRRSIRITSS
jgi:hypothetical protein